jgi:hypothetical protein
LQRKRHGSSESYLTKHQTGSLNAQFQQVPQLGSQQPQSVQLATDLALTQTNNNYLLMPAPQAALSIAPQPIGGGMQRSHSYHAGISAAAYETPNQGANSVPPVYFDLYMPTTAPQVHAHLPPPSHQHQHQPQTQPQQTYASSNIQSMILQQNQPLVMNTSNSTGHINASCAPLYTNGFAENAMK